MRLSEGLKIDTALTPVSLNGAGIGEYFSLANYRKALFLVELGAMAAAATSVLQVMQAQDAAGTNAKVVTNNAATITANTLAAAVALTIVTAAGGVHVAGQTVTIDGLVFTAAAADVPTSRTYAVGASGADSAAALLAKINSANPNIGVPGVVGVSAIDGANTVLTLTAVEPGDTAITAVTSAATTVVSTVRAVGYVECDAHFLDDALDFSHVAIRVTNSAAMLTGASLVRGNGRYTPTQVVAASKADVLP
ncbi:MAG: hypothetical protein A2001_01455 [Treponema sp. GWC1_61_84]|nr:MAG: hypothetical protein A2001_01455 [Treponema sp. GWC1_61_84]